MTKKETKSNKEPIKEAIVEKEHSHKCKCKKRKFARFLSTVIISSVVTASIIITVPLWMGKVLPAENQPAFLRKALMPITNVKVIATKPLPNDVDKYIDNANIELQNKLNESEAKIKQELAEYEKEIISIENHITKMEERNRISDSKWVNVLTKDKMFLVTFYNMKEKAMQGKPYAREMELLKLNTSPDMAINKDLEWVESYSKRPPFSLKALGRKVEKNSHKIIMENIEANETGFKKKFLIAINNMMQFRAPADSFKEGSLKYNLAEFIFATKTHDACLAMKIGKDLSSQSNWFKTNIMSELEARSRVNKELFKVSGNIEKQVYKDAIKNTKKKMQIRKEEK